MCSNEFVFYLNNTCVAWWQQRKNSHLFDYSGIFAKTRTGRYQTLSVISYACRISYDARKLLFRGRQILFFLFFFFFLFYCGILGPNETTALIFRLPFAVDGYAGHMVRTCWIFMKVQTLVFLFWDPSEPLPASVFCFFFFNFYFSFPLFFDVQCAVGTL